MTRDPRDRPFWRQRLWPRGRGTPPPPAPGPGVDLVGTSAPTPAAGHPFSGPSAPQDALAGETAEAWTFKQTVLLNPSARPTTVIVWTLVSGTGLLLLWSLLAPLGT